MPRSDRLKWLVCAALSALLTASLFVEQAQADSQSYPAKPGPAGGHAQVARRGFAVGLFTRTDRTSDGWAYQSVDAARSIFRQIRQQGGELIRLPVRPAPMLEGSDASRLRARAQVLAVVDIAAQEGLGVIVDMHPWKPADSDDYERGLICDPAARTAFQQMVVGLASVLAQPHKGWRALELLNEPKTCSVGGVVQWPIAQLSLVRQIRKVAPDLPLVVTGTNGQLDDLLTFDASPYVSDQNILFSFHFYEPFIFTTPEWFKLYEVPYPVGQEGVLAHAAAVARAVESDTPPSSVDNLMRYLAHAHGPFEVQSRFATASAWARRWNVDPSRIFVGEFGVIEPAGAHNPGIRAGELLWLKAVRSSADAAGFRSDYWIWPIHPGFDFDPVHGLRPDVAAAVGR